MCRVDKVGISVMSYFLEKCGCGQELVCDDNSWELPRSSLETGYCLPADTEVGWGEDVELSAERKLLARYISAK